MCCASGNGGYWYYDYGSGTYLFSGGSFNSYSYNQFCVGQGGMPTTPNTFEPATRQIQPELTNSLTVFPNPASDQITARIVSEKQQTAAIQVVNLSGQVVWQADRTLAEGQEELSIPVNDLPVGFYLLQVRTKDGNPMVQKFNVLR